MIVDTLSILLEVQGGNATIKQIQGVEKAMDKTEDTANKAGKSIQKVGQGYRDLRVGIMRVMAPLAAFGVIVNRTIDFAKQGENLLLMANSAGVAADKFSQLALAAERLGGSRQGMAAVLSSFSAGVMGLRRGEENQLTQAAMYYGVSLGGKNGLANPEEMLFNIARAMQGRSDMEQADMARMLGLDPGTFQLVRQGVEGVRRELELADKYNPFKDGSMEDMRHFMLQLREIKMAFSALTGELAKGALPHFERWGTAIKDSIDYFLDHLDAVKLGIIAIGTAFMAALGPVYLVLEGIFLIFDDLLTYMQGGDSLLGPLWEKIFHFNETPEEMQKRGEHLTAPLRNAQALLPEPLKNDPLAVVGMAFPGALIKPLKDALDLDRYITPQAVAAGGGGIFNISTYITTKDDPEAVGRAAESGVKDGVQSALDETSTEVR